MALFLSAQELQGFARLIQARFQHLARLCQDDRLDHAIKRRSSKGFVNALTPIFDVRARRD
jgi:hypothetical protein